MCVQPETGSASVSKMNAMSSYNSKSELCKAGQGCARGGLKAPSVIIIHVVVASGV